MIEILLADDHEILRSGLRSLLAPEPGMEVVAEAVDGREAVELARRLRPDVVIMDVAMPALNGVEATRQLMVLENPPRVLGLSMHSDARFIGRMLEAGASGYLLKDCAFHELAKAIRSVCCGETYLGSRITGSVVDDYVRRLKGGEAVVAPGLTDRQREVLQLLAEGHGTKHIAQRLHVSIKTVETHRQNIMEKLEVRSVAELTKYAIREGLTSL